MFKRGDSSHRQAYGYPRQYSYDKGKRAEQAKRHTKEMEEQFGKDLIPFSANKTRMYDTNFILRAGDS